MNLLILLPQHWLCEGTGLLYVCMIPKLESININNLFNLWLKSFKMETFKSVIIIVKYSFPHFIFEEYTELNHVSIKWLYLETFIFLLNCFITTTMYYASKAEFYKLLNYFFWNEVEYY